MKIYTYEQEGHMYEVWYHRPEQCWYAAEIDKDGNMGESITAYKKDWVIDYIKRGHCPSVKRYHPR